MSRSRFAQFLLPPISIPLDEWEEVEAMLSITQSDERQPYGQIRLRCTGGRRVWEATDTIRAARLLGGTELGDQDLYLSPNLVRFAAVAGRGGAQADLNAAIGTDGERMLVVSGPSGSLDTTELQRSFPDLDELAFAEFDIAASARATADDLSLLVANSRVSRIDLEETPNEVPMYELQVGDGRITASIDWNGCGPTSYSLVAAASSPTTASRRVDPNLLASLIRLFAPSDEVELRVPSDAARPMQLVGTNRSAALMPIQSDAQLARQHVEEVIDAVVGHLGNMRDDDGDYPLRRRQVPVFGRLVEAGPPLFQVFAVLLDRIEPSPELFGELNDLNASVRFARLFHVGSQVVAEVDLMAATLDPDELTSAIDGIIEVSGRIMPTLAAVFGGQVAEDPVAQRWRSYRSAIVAAEVSPDVMVTLNGSGAIADWPFPTPIHVITGWNPQGVSLGDESHHDVNVKIAADVLRHGGRFVYGEGRSADDSHVEPSLVAWGLDRATAVALGLKASQDAIMEIDAGEVRLVSCDDERLESWGRFD